MQYAVVCWLLTYLGSWFNLLTLVILGMRLCFFAIALNASHDVRIILSTLSVLIILLKYSHP